MGFLERSKLISEKFHSVKFDIFPLMKYEKPLVYISWLGTLAPFEQHCKEVIDEIFSKSEADKEELICMLGSNEKNEQFYQKNGFKTIHHCLLTDFDIGEVDNIYDSIEGDEKEKVQECHQVELFAMMKEVESPDIP